MTDWIDFERERLLAQADATLARSRFPGKPVRRAARWYFELLGDACGMAGLIVTFLVAWSLTN